MVNLEKLQELNRWWTKGDQFEWEDADLAKYRSAPLKVVRKDLLDKLAAGAVTVVKGPRRVGKTLMIKLAILELIGKAKASPDDILYFSFDEAVTLREMDTMIRSFLAKPHGGSTYIFLDEVQTVKGWAGIIQSLHDSGVLQDSAVSVTGSIAHFFEPETMPGRGTEGRIYLLRTASFRTFVRSVLDRLEAPGTFMDGGRLGYRFTKNEVEAMRALTSGEGISLETGLSEIYEKAQEAERYLIPLNRMFGLYIASGGYPLSMGGALSPGEGIPQQVYEEIYNYVKSDAATMAGLASGDPGKAGRVIGGVLARIGGKASYLGMARELSMNNRTLMDYYNRLENSFVFLSIFGMKGGAGALRDSKVKKFYFSDVFMHYAAGAVQTGKSAYAYTKELVNSSYIGTLVEEIVAGHLIRTKEHDPMRRYSTFVKFYDSPREIDFLYRREDGSHVGIEVKYQNGASGRDTHKAGGIGEYILLTKDTESTSANGMLTVPVSAFLAMLKESDHDL